MSVRRDTIGGVTATIAVLACLVVGVSGLAVVPGTAAG